MKNPIFQLLQSLPTNGWTTAIGGLGLLFFGIGGLLTGKIEADIAFTNIMLGLSALGLGSKIDKQS